VDSHAVFSAYGVTPGEDPVSHILRELTNSAAGQSDQIARLWQAVNDLTRRAKEQGEAPENETRQD